MSSIYVYEYLYIIIIKKSCVERRLVRISFNKPKPLNARKQKPKGKKKRKQAEKRKINKYVNKQINK